MKRAASCFLSQGHYTADACIVWCFDARFSPALREFVAAKGYENCDLIKIAGGAKCLASPDNESEREFVLKQIETSLRLHHARRIVLMNHCDCGAYGGSQAFGKDDAREKAALQKELALAEAFLESRLSRKVPIVMALADFEAVYELG